MKFNGYFRVRTYISRKIFPKTSDQSFQRPAPKCGKMTYPAKLKNPRKIPGSSISGSPPEFIHEYPCSSFIRAVADRQTERQTDKEKDRKTNVEQNTTSLAEVTITDSNTATAQQ